MLTKEKQTLAPSPYSKHLEALKTAVKAKKLVSAKVDGSETYICYIDDVACIMRYDAYNVASLLMVALTYKAMKRKPRKSVEALNWLHYLNALFSVTPQAGSWLYTLKVDGVKYQVILKK